MRPLSLLMSSDTMRERPGSNGKAEGPSPPAGTYVS
jgi:hypothetical protein